MFRQPDSLYAGVLLCSAIILAVVGGSLFWLRMPGDERLRNYRLSRRFVGWAYFSLAFTDVLWLLFLREEYELDFTRILVLAVAAVQATMFSGALVTLVNSRFPLARGVRRHLLAVAAGTASLFGCMLFFPQAFPVLFRLTAAAYCVQIALFARTFVREYRVCRRKLDNFFSDGEMRRLRWVAVSFLMTALIGLTAAAWLVSGLGMPYLFAFTGVYMVFYTFFGMKYINYPAEFGRIAPVIADDVPEPLAAGENIRTALDEWIAAKGYVRPGLSLESLAREVGCNRSYLSRYVNSELGLNFKSWIRALRIADSQRLLLEHPGASALEVGEMVGIHGRSTFFAQFSEVTGMSPGEYRRRYAGGDPIAPSQE